MPGEVQHGVEKVTYRSVMRQTTEFNPPIADRLDRDE